MVLRNLLLYPTRNEKVLVHKLNKISWHAGYGDICILAITQVSKTIRTKKLRIHEGK